MRNDYYTSEELEHMGNSVTSEEAFPEDPVAGDQEERINSYYNRLIAEELLKAHDLAREVMENKIDAAVVAIVGVNIDPEPVTQPHTLKIVEIFEQYDAAKKLLLNARNQCIANMYGWRIAISSPSPHVLP
jgi:hypothetical protein